MVFTCKKCNKDFKTSYELERHKNNKRPCDKKTLYVCEKCGYSNVNKLKYENHLARKTPCVRTLTITENDLNRHLDEFGSKIKQETEEKMAEQFAALKSVPKKKTVKNTIEYIYIVQEREFVNNDEDIYKIGKTSNNIRVRMNDYPKNSALHYVTGVIDSTSIEKKAIALFDAEFINMKNIGREYYKGDLLTMMQKLNKLVDENTVIVTTI